MRYVGTIIPDLYSDFVNGRQPVYELYNIRQDPSETSNILDVMPSKAEELKSLYFEYGQNHFLLRSIKGLKSGKK